MIKKTINPILLKFPSFFWRSTEYIIHLCRDRIYIWHTKLIKHLFFLNAYLFQKIPLSWGLKINIFLSGLCSCSYCKIKIMVTDCIFYTKSKGVAKCLTLTRVNTFFNNRCTKTLNLFHFDKRTTILWYIL